MAGRPKKELNENIDMETEVKDEGNNSQLDALMKKMEEMSKALESISKENEELKVKVSNASQNVVYQTPSPVNNKKIKVMSLMYNPIGVTTEPMGRGREFNFSNFGETRLISFDHLSDIVASYPNTMGAGMLYICDKDAVEALGLSEEYENLYTKEMLEEVKYLRRPSDVDLFVGMDRSMQESVAKEAAELINKNEAVDLNILEKIKDKTGIDIKGLAEELSAK